MLHEYFLWWENLEDLKISLLGFGLFMLGLLVGWEARRLWK